MRTDTLCYIMLTRNSHVDRRFSDLERSHGRRCVHRPHRGARTRRPASSWIPQTHITWRFVAPAFAENYTVILPDLPGYGKCRILSDGPRWTKRRAASALCDLLTLLGHETFAVVGHDRGARVGYRLALDHTDRVKSYASLTVIPTLDAWKYADMAFWLKNFHWFMLAQPNDLPERLLQSDPRAFLDDVLLKMAGSLECFESEVIAAYREAFQDPSVRHAMCEDYRAGAVDDLEMDVQDRVAGHKLDCPVCVIWPDSEGSSSAFPIETWRHWADDVTGAAINGNHLLPEFSAAAVIDVLKPFLARTVKAIKIE